MAYEMVMPYHLHMPSYFLETFTEYPYDCLVTLDKMQRPTCVCHRLIPVLIFREEEQKDKREKIRSFVLE